MQTCNLKMALKTRTGYSHKETKSHKFTSPSLVPYRHSGFHNSKDKQRQLWPIFSFNNDQRLRITKNIASLNSNKTCPSKCLALKPLVHTWDQHCPHKSEFLSFHLYDQSKQGMDRQNKNI